MIPTLIMVAKECLVSMYSYYLLFKLVDDDFGMGAYSLEIP
jgi:hypothetical protein